MRTWRCYLEGVSADMLTFVTDHNPLTYLQTQPVLSRRQTRWSEFLQMFIYKWLYRPGKRNVADPLSRSPGVVSATLPVAGPEVLCRCAAVHCLGRRQQLTFRWAQKSPEADKVSEPLPSSAMAGASVAAVTRSQVRPIPATVSKEPLPACDDDSAEQEMLPVSDLSEFQRLCAEAYAKDPAFQDESFTRQYTMKHGLWWAPHDVLVLPDADGLRQKVLHEMHDSPFSGHVGGKKTRKAIERFYTWPTLIRDVEHYVQTCSGCQQNKSSTQKPAGLAQPLPVPKRK